MHRHRARIEWQRGDAASGRNYSRRHTWTFDGGAVVPASSSPLVVPPPGSDPAAVDPEEAFVAAVASCHMLWFLYQAAEAGFSVESYADDAVGIMGRNDAGAEWVARIELRPRIAWGGGNAPAENVLRRLHDDAHHRCYIANSIRSEVVVL